VRVHRSHGIFLLPTAPIIPYHTCHTVASRGDIVPWLRSLWGQPVGRFVFSRALRRYARYARKRMPQVRSTFIGYSSRMSAPYTTRAPCPLTRAFGYSVIAGGSVTEHLRGSPSSVLVVLTFITGALGLVPVRFCERLMSGTLPCQSGVQQRELRPLACAPKNVSGSPAWSRPSVSQR
jgi:hypothetical protein